MHEFSSGHQAEFPVVIAALPVAADPGTLDEVIVGGVVGGLVFEAALQEEGGDFELGGGGAGTP